jgi:hypothetical protein
MDLSKISSDELLVRLEKLAHTERKITHLILWHINEIESRRLFADLGFGSMYEYLTKHLGYGESSAYRRIQSARLLKQIPHLSDKLESGALNLTQLTQVQKCLKQEYKSGNKVDVVHVSEVLEQIENKSNFDTQKFLAVEFNQPVLKHETIKPQQDNCIRLEITLTQEQMATLQHAKDLLSHVLPEASWADVISILAQKHVKKVMGKIKSTSPSKEIALENNQIDPKSIGAATPMSMKSSSEHFAQAKLTSRFFTKQERKHIKITTKRKLLVVANHCCEFQSLKTGRKCQSTYQLQSDHRIPLALGGSNETQNFRVLCRTHNLLEARKLGLNR